MQLILKYTLLHYLPETIRIPGYAGFLCIEVQNNSAVLYIKSDTRFPEKEVTIVPVLTGQEVDIAAAYLGTAMLDEGRFVVHYFMQ